jgi:hypothetical protein
VRRQILPFLNSPPRALNRHQHGRAAEQHCPSLRLRNRNNRKYASAAEILIVLIGRAAANSAVSARSLRDSTQDQARDAIATIEQQVSKVGGIS